MGNGRHSRRGRCEGRGGPRHRLLRRLGRHRQAPRDRRLAEQGRPGYALDPAGGGPTDFDGLTGTASDQVRQGRPQERPGYPRWTSTATAGPTCCCSSTAWADLGLDQPRVRGVPGEPQGRRGFGCPQGKVPFALTPTTPWAAADVDGDKFDDLLILAEDGTLYEVKNTPREKKVVDTGLRF